MKTICDIEKRWETGIPHHPEAERIARLCAAIDCKFGGDSLGLKFGGDGDNGEALTYLLDVIFDAFDNDETEALKKKVKP